MVNFDPSVVDDIVDPPSKRKRTTKKEKNERSPCRQISGDGLSILEKYAEAAGLKLSGAPIWMDGKIKTLEALVESRA